jgi:hypothetical protein
MWMAVMFVIGIEIDESGYYGYGEWRILFRGHLH